MLGDTSPRIPSNRSLSTCALARRRATCSLYRAQLRKDNGGRQVGHAIVVTDYFVLVPLPHALVAQHTEPIGHSTVGRGDDPALTEDQILGDVEREAASAETSGRPAREARSVCLRSIFDEVEAVAAGDSRDPVEVGRLTVQVYRHDCGRPRSDRVCDRIRVEPEVVVTDVDKPCARIQQTKNVQAARQIRFTNVREIVKMEPILKAYIYEAIEVEKAGLKVNFKKTSEFQNS